MNAYLSHVVTSHRWISLGGNVCCRLCRFFTRQEVGNERNAMRIKRENFLSLAVLNGALGAFLGRVVSHHKTEKRYFSMTIYLGLLCQIGVGDLRSLFVWVL